MKLFAILAVAVAALAPARALPLDDLPISEDDKTALRQRKALVGEGCPYAHLNNCAPDDHMCKDKFKSEISMDMVIMFCTDNGLDMIPGMMESCPIMKKFKMFTQHFCIKDGDPCPKGAVDKCCNPNSMCMAPNPKYPEQYFCTEKKW
eukprot:CAMPEP_0197438862 /NCGR_PEP_ID=MMETSP1175-20131217/5745_1 /TAXON_ID=1003142 /ORGANISM="Triceratium dubium, Strain CCMP147" /LENGTH=147 /DNA_ID=CAMNT_0042968671 /DNA_START=172 /DNA_END=615 /DNA_ORIENTATION=+